MAEDGAEIMCIGCKYYKGKCTNQNGCSEKANIEQIRSDVIEEIIEEIDYLNHQGGGLDDLLLYLNKMKEQKR